MKREDVFYEAMRARDPRFDGKFFVGVRTTGIYCRPICPAKPKRENVEFFANHLAAERAGYRPCLRCRPESAPRSPAWIGKTAVVQRAVKVLHDQISIDLDEDQFASRFGVTARHLRRLFVEEIGKTPKQLALENRLNLSRTLLSETSMAVTEVAFASGFQSIRRFNDAFKARFKKSPSEIRKTPGAATEKLQVSLSYRPPFDFAGLLRSYDSHRVGNLEWIRDGKWHRVIKFGKTVGSVAIVDDPEHSCLRVEIDFADTSHLHAILARVRALFDLDSDPVVIANALELDAKIKSLLKKTPGVRIPTGWEPFEVAIATILGQLVSVDRGRALVADLIELLGEDSGLEIEGRRVKLFPSAQKIAQSDLSGLKTTGARKRSLIAFSQAVVDRTISLEPTQDVDEFVERAQEIPGIGPWTASYMALKVLRHTDAFPETDLILARALENHAGEVINQMRPWRGYVAALLWREYTRSEK